jgi:hypothetical protein
MRKTLASMLAQPLPPKRWVIVNDRSTNETPDIAKRYTEGVASIELISRAVRRERSFCGGSLFNPGLQRVSLR